MDLKVFNHKYEESDVTFLIRGPIQFESYQNSLNMATLKILNGVLHRNLPKTAISLTFFMIYPVETNTIAYI